MQPVGQLRQHCLCVSRASLTLLTSLITSLSISRELAETLGGIYNSTVFEHLKVIGFMSKLSKWIPHQLTDVQRQLRCDAALTLLSFKRHQNWLSSIVISDEKWIHYVNVVRRRSWCAAGDAPQSTAKPGLHPKKVMLSVWCD